MQTTMQTSNEMFDQQVAEIEQHSIHKYVRGQSTYEAIKNGAQIAPNKVAIKFLLQGDYYDKKRIPLKAHGLRYLVKLLKRHDFAAPYQEITFAKLLENINKTANILHRLGVGKNDVVSVMLPNFIETHFALWGAEATGIANPVNPMLEAETIADILKAAHSKVLITLGPLPGSDIWQKVKKIKQLTPCLEKIIVLYGKHSPKQDIYDFHTCLKRESGAGLDSKRIILADDAASMFHTGGTTGTPKLAVHTHFNEVANAAMSALNVDHEESDSALVGLPLFHVNAAIGTGLMPLSMGLTIVLAGPAGFRTQGVFENFYAMLEHFGVSYFSAVPTIYSELLKYDCRPYDFSKVKFAISGAAPIPVSVFREFQQKTNIRLLEGYGLTEGTCVSSITPLALEPKIGSIGKPLPFSSMQIAIFDGADNYLRPASVNEIGTLITKGPNVFKGYLQDQHNEGLWVNIDGQKWLNTGDMARCDVDGFFWLTGRKKELIIRGGHNIDPKTIEESIMGLKGVESVAAVGRPDAHAGELPVAYVVTQDDQITEAMIVEYAKKCISERAAIPKHIRIIKTMPVTAVGKIFKPQLVWWEAEDVSRQALNKILQDNNRGSLPLNIIAQKDEKSGYVVNVYVDNKAPIELIQAFEESLGKFHFQHKIGLIKQLDQ